MKKDLKCKAIQMRIAGNSLTSISRRLKVAKSTVSLWVRDVVVSESAQNKIKSQAVSAAVIERRRSTRLQNEIAKRKIISDSAQSRINPLSNYELLIGGSLLYWAEGGKTQRGLVRFSNSDPNMIAFMMKFFRVICNVPEEKFRCYIHMYDSSIEPQAKKYWSGITKVPEAQFFKTYVKRTISGKLVKNNLPFGTIEIYVSDTKLFLTIQGWVFGIFSHELP